MKVGSCIGWLLLAFVFEGLKASRSYFLSQCQPGYAGNSPIWRLLERPYCLASAIYVVQVWFKVQGFKWSSVWKEAMFVSPKYVKRPIFMPKMSIRIYFFLTEFRLLDFEHYFRWHLAILLCWLQWVIIPGFSFRL